jgi:hypothetical protein
MNGFQPQTTEKIAELVEDNYCEEDILEFINEHGEDNFHKYYDEYVISGEKIGYDAVDAYIEQEGIRYVEDCHKKYVGKYKSTKDFAYQYYHETMDMDEIENKFAIDWQTTYDEHLADGYDACDGIGCVYIFHNY